MSAHKGFVQLSNDLFLRAAEMELDAVDVALVGAVEARRNSKTGKSFASQKTIGEALGLSASGVEKRFRRLRELGYLVTSDRQHDARGQSTGQNYDFGPLFERVAALPTAQSQPSSTSGLGASQPSSPSVPNPPGGEAEQDVGNKTNYFPPSPQAGESSNSDSSEEETLQLHHGGSALHAVPDEEAPDEDDQPRGPRYTVDLFRPPPKIDGRKRGRKRDHDKWGELVAAFVAEHYPDPDWAAGNPAKACEAVEKAIRRGARTPEKVHEHIECWWIEPARRRARRAS